MRAYIVWAVPAIAFTFLKNKLNHDNLTHIIIAGIIVVSFALPRLCRPRNPERFFIISGVILAALVEGAYMISKPVLPSLLVEPHAGPVSFACNYAIDLLLTVPVYAVIFWVIWRLINRFNYTRGEYIFLMALGQALGDGFATFLAQPVLLLFIPYVMLNYHAMNIAPFLCIEHSLGGRQRSATRWKYPLAVAALFVTYLLGGVSIQLLVRLFNLG